MRGSRVQAVSNELGNERIDIVVWEDDQAKLLVNTLSPAEILSIVMDDENRTMEVVVKDENLALAIGRNGQNIRLASELVGWQIQIKGESSGEEDAEVLKLIEYLGVDRNLATKLIENGLETVQKISESKAENFPEIDGLGEEDISTLIDRAEESLLEIALLELDEEGSETELQEARKIEISDGFTDEEIKTLNKDNIETVEDLADLATDELIEIIEIDDKRAAELIMSARGEWLKD